MATKKQKVATNSGQWINWNLFLGKSMTKRQLDALIQRLQGLNTSEQSVIVNQVRQDLEKIDSVQLAEFDERLKQLGIQ